MTELQAPSSVQAASPVQATTGVSGLDDVLCGGLTSNRLYLVEGVPGSGKTTLALQYLIEGARRGERVLPVRILVVDDNRDAADSLGMLLRFVGAETEVAHDGDSALRSLESFQPAMILLDLGMPGMDGYEVARRIREQQAHREVMLIALTGWGQEEDRRRARSAGFDHHLIKPAGIETLQALMATAAQRQEAREGGRPRVEPAV